MIRKQITVQNKLGIHTRAAAKLVDVAKRFACKIELNLRERAVDCKSIMGAITLGAKKGDIVEIILTGEDEAQAFEAIEKLINDKFDED